MQVEELFEFSEAHFISKANVVLIDAMSDPAISLQQHLAGKNPAEYVIVQTALLGKQRFPLRKFGMLLFFLQVIFQFSHLILLFRSLFVIFHFFSQIFTLTSSTLASLPH